MRLPETDELRSLVGWEPPHGVLSVYVAIDPGDRGGAWRIELRDRLDEAVAVAQDDPDRERRLAIQATAGRIAERFDADGQPSGRVQIGFVEVRAKHAHSEREEWFAVQYPVAPTMVAHGPRPNLRPLAEILDDGRARGVVALSSERVRLFGWRLGSIEEVANHEFEFFERDWRERKAPQMRDPASGQAVSSAGKDQYDQRLDQNRRRFLKEAGRLACDALDPASRGEVLCIGEPGLCEVFLGGWETHPGRVTIDPHDVIAEPTQAIAERAAEKLAEADVERDSELIDRAIGSAASPNGSGALGPSDVARALVRGQVERLLIDAESELDAGALDAAVREEIEAARPLPEGRLDEWIAEEAIRTAAEITAVRDEQAERLADHGGVAAILRY